MSARLAIDDHRSLHEPDSVAVIDVPVDVDDGERLDRFPIELVPAINGDAVRLLVEPVGHHDILLDPRDEFSQLSACPLFFNDRVVLQEGRG